MSDTADFAALEKREWASDDVARAYVEVFSKAADMVVPSLVEGAGGKPGVAALDVCCGHGNVSAGLMAVGCAVTGLDFSRAMLDLARATVPGVIFVEGDAMALPFEARSFDTVTIGFGMPHVPDPPRLMAEARRVLRPGGRLAFSVWCGPEVDTALVYVFDAIAEFGDPSITLPPGPGANDYANPDRAFPALEASGFAKPQITTVASYWQVTDPGAPFDYFLSGTARGGALLRPQPAKNAAAIRQAVVEKVLDNHGGGPSWKVPIPAVVISAKAH